MQFRILVEADVSLLLRKDRVVTSHVAVFAGEPVRAALPKYDVTGNNELGGSLFGTESFARARGGFVCATLRGVRGGAGMVEWEEREPLK